MSATGEGLRYPADYQEDASTGRAVALVRDADLEPGVVLDLGAGAGAVAEPLRDLGYEYVGADVDAAGLAAIAERGFEVHELDLAADEDELAEAVTELLGDRPLAGLLALDVLEHLPDPSVALRALRRVVLERAGREPAPLVVSIPNVTHGDVAAKLALGRWDVDAGGLLDDTHLRFFSEAELERLLRLGGWSQAAAADTTALVSDQCHPVDAPTLRPGAPLHDLLADVRATAEPNATTYQFVRRLLPHPDGPQPAPYVHEPDEERPLLEVVVVGDERTARPLVDDLLAQRRSLTWTVEPPERLHDTLRRVGARWVAVLDARARLAPGWAARLAEVADEVPGRVVQLPVVLVDGEPESFEAWVGTAPSPTSTFDPLHLAPPAPVVPSAHLVPGALAEAAGVRPDPDRPVVEALVAWLARAVTLSGLTVLDGEPLVAVPATAAVDAGVGQELVVEELDRTPFLAPAGTAARAVALRDRVLAAEARAAAAEAQAHGAELTIQSMALHLDGVDRELERLRPELFRLREEHRRRPSRRVLDALRSLLGGRG